MKIKKRIIVAFSIIAVLSGGITYLCVGTDLIKNINLIHFTNKDFDKKYLKELNSTDGRLTIVSDNSQVFFGVPTIFEGYYHQENGENIKLYFFSDGSPYATTEYDSFNYFFFGNSHYNYLNSTYTIYVTEVNDTLSPYKPGDRIEFHIS